MKVEIESGVSESLPRLGAGVPYALKVVAARLAEEPDLGEPSGLPGILSLKVEGDLFEDCPDLDIGYIREKAWIQIRFVAVISSDAADADTQEQEQEQEYEPERPADPAADALIVRQTADAWHRITTWLRRHAPDSLAALRPGASPAELAALEDGLGVRIPVGLRALWMLTAGDDGVRGGGCLPGNRALLTLEDVAEVHRAKTAAQAREDARPKAEPCTLWKAGWIPVVAWGSHDRTSGLYLDAGTGCLGHWPRYDEAPGEELDTLVTYLEETADMLEAPALSTRDEPGLVDGALVWRSRIDPAQKDRWGSL